MFLISYIPIVTTYRSVVNRKCSFYYFFNNTSQFIGHQSGFPMKECSILDPCHLRNWLYCMGKIGLTILSVYIITDWSVYYGGYLWNRQKKQNWRRKKYSVRLCRNLARRGIGGRPSTQFVKQGFRKGNCIIILKTRILYIFPALQNVFRHWPNVWWKLRSTMIWKPICGCGWHSSMPMKWKPVSFPKVLDTGLGEHF